MSLFRSIRDRFPAYVPTGTIKVEETFEFVETPDGHPKTVYTIDKGPVERLESVSGTVGGSGYTFTVGSEVEIRDTTDDGLLDSIAFIDSSVHPDVGTDVTATYVANPIIERYTEPFDADLNSLGDEIENAIDAKYVDTAEGSELDLIGSAFGEFGLRQGRSDPEYTSFLKSVVRAFNATGTASDMKFAIAAAVNGELSDITINEDFEQVGFTVFIESVDSELITESLDQLIQLSKPTGVELLKSPSVVASRSTIVVSGSSVDSKDSGLGSGTLSDGSTLN